MSQEELSEEQVDQLVDAERGSRDIPMHAEKEAVQDLWKEDSFKLDGKDIKGTREQILHWASMGYNYPQRAEALNKKEAEWARTLQEKEKHFSGLEQTYSPYKQVDEFAKANPQWWAHIQESMKQKLSGAESNADVSRIKQEFLQELAPMKEFMQTLQQKESAARIEKEDADLGTEIDSIKKQYPNIDFVTPNQEGLTLEAQVLKHAVENKFPNFRSAFRDYYHDQLVAKAQDQAKQTVAKNVQKQTKLGILGETSKPTKGLQVATNVKSKSWNDLLQEAIGELNS